MRLAAEFLASSRNGLAVLAMSMSVIVGCAPGAALAASHRIAAVPPQKVPAGPNGPKSFEDSAMRVVLVKGGQPNCTVDCPEWIAAQGTIVPATTQAFEQAFAALGDRKLPVFVNSPGGDVDAGIAIGRMLRERHLTVAVARTAFDGCAPGDKVCGKEHEVTGYRGTAVSIGTECASSCVMVLAGGEKRYIASDAKIGVHQVATVMFENISSYKFSRYDVSDSIIQVERELVSERLIPRARMQVDNSAKVYRQQITPYFTEMGVSDKIVALMQQTDPSKVHWMTAKELLDTKLLSEVKPIDALFAPTPTAAAAPVIPAKVAVADFPMDRELRRSE